MYAEYTVNVAEPYFPFPLSTNTNLEGRTNEIETERSHIVKKVISLKPYSSTLTDCRIWTKLSGSRGKKRVVSKQWQVSDFFAVTDGAEPSLDEYLTDKSDYGNGRKIRNSKR